VYFESDSESNDSTSPAAAARFCCWRCLNLACRCFCSFFLICHLGFLLRPSDESSSSSSLSSELSSLLLSSLLLSLAFFRNALRPFPLRD
jgi:hypothetical protein